MVIVDATLKSKNVMKTVSKLLHTPGADRSLPVDAIKEMEGHVPQVPSLSLIGAFRKLFGFDCTRSRFVSLYQCTAQSKMNKESFQTI